MAITRLISAVACEVATEVGRPGSVSTVGATSVEILTAMAPTARPQGPFAKHSRSHLGSRIAGGTCPVPGSKEEADNAAKLRSLYMAAWKPRGALSI